MTAADLLANLKGRGFRLELDDDGIAVIPFSRLTKTLHRQIRENKSELMVLLDAEAQAARTREAHVEPPEPLPVPVVEKAPVPEPEPRVPYLCEHCQQFHYPACNACIVKFPNWPREPGFYTPAPGHHPCVQVWQPGGYRRLENGFGHTAS